METSSAPHPFEQLGIIPPVVEVLRNIGYETPTAIQSSSIPVLLSGRDLLGQAQTGTGKTGAFALPLLSMIELDRRSPQVLVLTPTRELAIQVAEAFQTYARGLKSFHVIPIYGGQSMSTQFRQLERGAQVIVGTPGRIMDHLRRESLDLSGLRTVVLDEADEMLNMGFVEDIEAILEFTPEEKQTILFSATIPAAIRRVAAKYLRDPEEIKIQTKTSTVETISQHYWLVSGLHKLDALTRILEVEEYEAALIFVRTKTATVELAEKLEARGHACAALNGDLSQELRERTINAMKKGTLDIIVATDVAARGLDVDRITHVINYDIPHDPEAYVHRIGRTGRAGRSGKAILFVAPREQRMLNAIERATKQLVEKYELPTRNEVSQKRIERFKEELEQTLKEKDLSFYLPIVQQAAAEQGTSELNVAAALCFLIQQESPFILEETGLPREKREKRNDHRERFSEERGERRRDDRPRRERGPHDDSDKRTYRIEVGRNHGATPGNIVGAIANSAGLEGSNIGRIELYGDFSTVDLPKDLPSETLSYLQNIQVRDQKLRIEPYDNSSPRPEKFHRERSDRRPRRERTDRQPGAFDEKRSFERPDRAARAFRDDRQPAERGKRAFGGGKRAEYDSAQERPHRGKGAFEEKRSERPDRDKRGFSGGKKSGKGSERGSGRPWEKSSVHKSKSQGKRSSDRHSSHRS